MSDRGRFRGLREVRGGERSERVKLLQFRLCQCTVLVLRSVVRSWNLSLEMQNWVWFGERGADGVSRRVEQERDLEADFRKRFWNVSEEFQQLFQSS